MRAGHVACGRGGTAACVFSPPQVQVSVVVAQQDGLAGGSRCCCIVGHFAAVRVLLGVVDVRQGRERGDWRERRNRPWLPGKCSLGPPLLVFPRFSPLVISFTPSLPVLVQPSAFQEETFLEK